MDKKTNKSLLIDREKTIESLKQEIFQLREIIDNFPGDVYWKDKAGVWLGVNKRSCENLRSMGFLTQSSDIIGKTDEEIFGKVTAKIYRDNDETVMNENREIAFEEETILPSGHKVIKYSTKKPLYNPEGKIVGVIGSSMDITARKEAEKLKVKNAEQKVKIAEQEKFAKIANQLSHDIRSPLAATQIWYESICHKLSEQERVVGGNALSRALDILNSGFVHYKQANNEESRMEQNEPVLVSLALEQILAEKRLEYQHEPVALTFVCEDADLFAFASVKKNALKRMVSNLVNNAMESLEGRKNSEVTIYLNTTATTVTLSVEDNGRGMPDTVREKLLNQEVITAGKAYGNGIGFIQIWDTLKESHAKLDIHSTLNKGTRIDITFPRETAPLWAVTSLSVTSNQIIVVVDDDINIHQAWNSRFHMLVPGKKLVHFEQGEEAVAYLNAEASKDNILLLIDYELLNQPLNGLDIIEKTKIPHAILVTSHTENKKIYGRAIALNARLLPKQLAGKIPITLQETPEIGTPSVLSPTEVVVLDDDSIILNSMVSLVFSKRKVETYTRPQDCLAKLDTYRKETIFFMDYHYGINPLTGIEVAKQLHEHGFHRLYLLTGDDMKISVPPYLTVILKTEIERLKAIATEG